MGELDADKARVKVAGGLAQGVRKGSLVLRDKEICLDETENESGV